MNRQSSSVSLDVEVWVRRPALVSSALMAASSDWEHDEQEYVLEDDGWQLLVAAAELGEPADADPAIAPALDGSEHVVYLTLEPIGAPRAAVAVLARVVRELVERCGGAAMDVDTGEVLTAP